MVLKYKGEDYSDLVITSYDYRNSVECGGGGSGAIQLDQYGYAMLGAGGGKNTSITRENDRFTLNVSWIETGNEPRKETLELKAVNKSVPPAKLQSYIRFTNNQV